MGLLPATREPLEHGSARVIDLRDFTSFLQSYTALASQSKACESSTRGMTARLTRPGVPIIEPTNGLGTLVKLSDLWSALKSVETVPRFAI